MLRHKSLFKFFLYGGLLLLISAPLIHVGMSYDDQIGATLDPLTTPQSATSVDSNLRIKNLTRVLTIETTGILSIEDNYIFENEGPNTYTSLFIGLTAEEADELVYFKAFDENFGPLTPQLSELKLNQTNILQVVLTEPLLPYSEITINLRTALKGFIRYDSLYGRFISHIQVIPKSPYPITYYTSEVHVPSDATEVQFLDNSMYVGPLDGELANVHRFYPGSASAFTDRTNTLYFYNTEAQILQINQLDRTITVNPWGYIKVVEDHYLQCFSTTYSTSLTLSLPEDYKNLQFSDDIGEILGAEPAETPNDDGTIDVTLNFITNRAPLQYGQKMYYRLSYELPIDNYMSNYYGKKNFGIDLYPTKMDYLIINLDTHIQLMAATSIEEINLNSQQIVESSKGMEINMNDYYVTTFHTGHFDVTYKTNGFLLADRAIIFSFIFIALMAIYVVMSSRKEKSDEIVISATAIPIKELQQFVTLYEEKNALMIELDTLEEKYLGRKVAKKAFIREEKTLSTKLKEIEEEIMPFKRDLLESSTAVMNVIQKLDYLEAEKISLKDSIQTLNNRYRKGKLPSKAAYDKLSRDFIKKLGDAQRKIDRNINELRAYLI